MKALWNGQVIAESDNTIVVENHLYFPQESVNFDFLQKNGRKTEGDWKGESVFYDIVVGDQTNFDAAWTCDNPTPQAQHIEGRVAFADTVEIVE